jgi:signal transduction histidine kinase/HPt (histidine-containing phosphotransfer) domain-containing protein
MRAILDDLPGVAFAVDREGRIDFLRGLSAGMIGSPNQLVGCSVFDVFAEFPSLQEDLRRSLGGERVNNRTEIAGRMMDTLLEPLRDTNGDISGVVGVTAAVTELKGAEEQTRTAMRLAESASRAKSDFLANLSHEIRTPMNGVLGLLDLTLDTALTGNQREYLKGARMSAEALLTVLNDVLDYSRLEARQLQPKHVDFDLLAVLENVGLMMAITAAQKGLPLTFDVDESTPTLLKGDPGRLCQILVNLVGNAVKFTHRGEVSIRITTPRHTGDAAVLRFEVADTGIGLSPDLIPTIFEPFVQADSGITRKYGGTGLGLAICRQLTALMHGEIGVASEERRGSTFWFTIECEKQMGLCAKPQGKPAELDGLRILLADDHESSRKVASKLLRKLGCRVNEVINRKALLEELGQAAGAGDPFRVVLFDSSLGAVADSALGGAVPVSMHLWGDPTQLQPGRAHMLKPIFEKPLRELLTGITAEPAFSKRPTASPVFDADSMLERLMQDRELAETLIGVFLNDVPQQMNALAHSLATGDAAGAHCQAHSLKGAAGVISAERFSETAARIERAAGSGEVPQAAAYASELEDRLDELKAALGHSGWAPVAEKEYT